MKTLIILLIVSFATFNSFAQKVQASKVPTQSTLTTQSTYSCPMHKDVVSNEPGKCSKCNMDLVLTKKEQLNKGIMKDYACPMHKEVISNMAGTCAKCGKELVVIDRKGGKEGRITYVCAMHPDVVANKAGKCPKCGMELTKAKN